LNNEISDFNKVKLDKISIFLSEYTFEYCVENIKFDHAVKQKESYFKKLDLYNDHNNITYKELPMDFEETELELSQDLEFSQMTFSN
jgi:hypothetical protein